MEIDEKIVLVIEDLLRGYSADLGDVLIETEGDDEEANYRAAVERESIRRALDHIGYQRYLAHKKRR